ncbi:MAG: hypothetical protein QXD23_00495 [Candidatus Micrarchaeaceae archaeon]
MFLEIFSVGAIDALVPVLIIVIFIGAAAGISRGFSFFNLFGIGTLMGLSPKGKGTLAQKTFKKSYVRGSQKPLKVTKKTIKDEKSDKEIKNDFNRIFKNQKTAATIDNNDKNPKGAGQLKEPERKNSSIFVSAFEKSLILTSPLVRGSYGATKGFINMVTHKGRFKKLTGVVYQYKEEKYKLGEKDFARYTNRGSDTILDENILGLVEARKKVLNEREKILSNKKLSNIEKKLLIANLTGLDKVFSKRLQKLQYSFNQINKLKNEYDKQFLEITKINNKEKRDKKLDNLEKNTYEQFSNTYKKLFNTVEDYRVESLKSKIKQIRNKSYGNFEFKFLFGGRDKNEKNKKQRTIIEFNSGRKENSDDE